MAADIPALPELIIVRVSDEIRPEVVRPISHRAIRLHQRGQVLDRPCLEEEIITVVGATVEGTEGRRRTGGVSVFYDVINPTVRQPVRRNEVNSVNT